MLLGTCMYRLMSVKLLGCLCYVCTSCFLQAFHCAFTMAVNIQFHGDSCLQKTMLAKNALLWMILPFSIVLIFLSLSVHSVPRVTSRWKESHKNRYLLLNTVWSSAKPNAEFFWGRITAGISTGSGLIWGKQLCGEWPGYPGRWKAVHEPAVCLCSQECYYYPGVH